MNLLPSYTRTGNWSRSTTSRTNLYTWIPGSRAEWKGSVKIYHRGLLDHGLCWAGVEGESDGR